MSSSQKMILQPRPNVKQVNYLAKTFGDFRQNLIEFTKAYYPNTYSDFNETSPGMMFIEMAASIGDVLSFYIDNQFKENLLAYAEQPENVISISQFLGYKPKLVAPANTEIEMSFVVPAVVVSGEYVPNSKYLPQIQKGTAMSTNAQFPVKFRLVEDVDFNDITTDEYVTNEYGGGGTPLSFIVTKTVRAQAGYEKEFLMSVGSVQRFTTIQLPDEPIVGIERVIDSDGNRWYEVDYLAQDVIMDDVVISDNAEDGQLPKVGLRLRKVPRRFVTRITRDFKTQLVFGSGESNDSEVDILIDSRQIATSQYGNSISTLVGNTSINNFNFLNSSAFGLSPSNTTLTIRYIIGGGIETNSQANTIVNIDNLLVSNDITDYTTAEQSLFNQTVQTAAVINLVAATGGGEAENIEEIRQNTLMFFNAQNRSVTADDYVIRSYSLPSKYGRIAKAYALRDEQLNSIMSYRGGSFVENAVKPTSINLYTLGYNDAGKLTTLNTITKNNLARYLEQYRMLTDDINILDAFIINIGVRFDITVFKNYNVRDVLARSIDAIQQFFEIDKWTINQPIIIADLIYQIGSVEGVQTVANVEIFNRYLFKDGLDYQPYRYDMVDATVNGIVYPSLDPSIFEIKYPQSDIIGSAIQ